jgi:hypothetical protein
LCPYCSDTSRFKRPLDDLYDLRRIDRKDRSDLHEGLITYNITQKGREKVQVLRNELVKDIIGTPEVEGGEEEEKNRQSSNEQENLS